MNPMFAKMEETVKKNNEMLDEIQRQDSYYFFGILRNETKCTCSCVKKKFSIKFKHCKSDLKFQQENGRR